MSESLDIKGAISTVKTLLEASKIKEGKERFTMDEIVNMLKNPSDMNKADSDNDETEVDDTPAVLNFIIYYGSKRDIDDKSNPVQVPDPSRPLYYFDPKNDRTFDCENGAWSSGKSSILNSLYSREFTDENQNEDLVNAIILGVMDDSDMDKLSKVEQIFDPRLKKLYELTKRAQSLADQAESLEKSDDIEGEPLAETSSAPESSPAPTGVLGQILAGIPSTPDTSDEVLVGRNILAELKYYSTQGGLTKTMIKVIREEIKSALLAEGLITNEPMIEEAETPVVENLEVQ